MTDERFFAWLDGELDPAEAAEVAAQVAADPDLSRKADAHRALQQRLDTAFGTVLDAPMPAGIASLTQGTADVVDLAEQRKRRSAWTAWSPSVQWGAIAATLAIGIATGTMIAVAPPGAPVQMRDGAVFAASTLDEALDSQLASAPGGDARIGLTFRDHDGRLCRSFTSADSSGLACRDGEDWRIRGLFSAPEGQASEYRMATGADPHLSALIESTIAGDPFDARAEAEAKARGWR